MTDIRYPGYPEFVTAAAGRLGRPEAADPARRLVPLHRFSSLVGAAVEHARADPGDELSPGARARVEEVMRAAAVEAVSLHIAAAAADDIHRTYCRELGIEGEGILPSAPESESSPETETDPQPRSTRHGRRTQA